MSETDGLPDFYVSDAGQRIGAPTYEALMQCQLIMASPETGQTGPTLVEPGEHFTTDAVPCHQWKPLNRAAEDRFEQWLASLPQDGKAIPQECITEAAYTMRGRQGDAEVPIEHWWPQVIRLAAQLADKRRGQFNVAPPVGFRPSNPNTPPMPFSAMGPSYPTEPGRAPAVHQPQSPTRAQDRARAARVKPGMPNTLPAGSPQQAAG